MTNDRSEYRPISCEFHDLLEAIAVTRQPTQIRFRAAGGEPQQRPASIRDVFSRAGAEYLSIGTGEIVRLDHLIEVDGSKLADD